MGIARQLGRLSKLLVVLLVVVGSLSAFATPSATLAAAVPGIWVSYDHSPSIGDSYWINVYLDNTSPTDTGYGPYVDVFLPAAGADGAGAAVDDGITFTGASLDPLSPTPLYCSGGSFSHPLTRRATACRNGDQVLVFELPFGSFAPDQPSQLIRVNTRLSNLADPGTPLELRVNAGFWLGNDPLDNPASDPPITASAGPFQITPAVPLSLSKFSSFSVTVTGYSFPRQFSISSGIPVSQRFSNLRLSDLLPPTMVYSGTNDFSPSAPTCSLAKEPPTTGPQLPPNNELTINCPSMTGPGGPSANFTYWVPRLDAYGQPILDPQTGAPRELGNDASVRGDWQPFDSRDAPFTIPLDPAGPEASVTALSLDLWHGWANNVDDPQGNGISPGDTLEFQLSFEISDYFSFGNIVITDTLADGLRYLPGSASLSVTDRDGALSGAFTDGASLTIDTSQIGNTGVPGDGTDGSTRLSFNLSRALRDLGDPDGIVRGAEAALPRGSAARGTITFRVLIQERFSDDYPSGDPSVDMHDWLWSDATISAKVVNNQTLMPTGGTVTRSDSTYEYLDGPYFEMTVYALNGAVCATQPCPQPMIEPADTVTYRLTYTMPFVDVEDPAFYDFLPSPVFSATEVLTTSPILASGPPPPGRVAYGPADNFHSLPGAPKPRIGVDPLNNMVSFVYADYDLDSSPAGVIDLLFTVTASDRPFDNQLYITNLASASEGSTNRGGGYREQSVQIGLEPLVLRLRKGVVAAESLGGRFNPSDVGPVAFSPPGGAACPRFTGAISSNALAARPINSDLRNLLVGERLTFAIVLENYGPSAGGAFDITLRDKLPAGLLRTSSPICVTDGTGARLTYSELAGGLFGDGIRLNDPGATARPAGALDPYSPSSGRNLTIITYDVTVARSVAPPATLINSATLFNYAEAEGGDDTGRDKTDSATVTVVDPTAISLLYFTAASEGNHVAVRWATGSELNTQEFILLRSADGARAAAVAVSERIPARGVGGGGAEYSWTDHAPPPGSSYAYWLVEVERGGASSEYGPARPSSGLQGNFRLMLPTLMR